MNPFLRYREQLLCVVQARIWIFVSVLLWGSWQSVFAAAPTVSPYCTVQKLTDEPVYSWSTSEDGSRIAFSSLSPEPGSHPRNPRYTAKFFLLSPKTGAVTQLASYTLEEGFRTPTIMISANGERIVFSSSGNPVWENADRNFEIFLFDIVTGILTQITNTTDSDNSVPVISANGTRIAFLSDMDLLGGNIDHSQEVFLFDTTTGIFTQITHTTESFRYFSPHLSFSLNANGTRIALASEADLTGDNPDGTVEIFLWHATSKTFTQITDIIRTETTSGHNFDPTINDPAINADGTRIVFQSTEDFTGENSDRNGEIFLFDTHTNTFTQITHTADNSAFRRAPFISADGTRIAFAGPKDMVENAPDDDVNSSLESEVFLFDTTTNTLTQITYSNGGTNSSRAISADGTQITFFAYGPTIIVVGADLWGYDWPPDSVLLTGADLRGYDWLSTSDIDTGLFTADCALPDAQSPPLVAALESPEAGPVSGVTAIHGWAFAPQSNVPDVQVDQVSVLVDGVPLSETPCCSERGDVRAVFPQFSSDHTANSGWGTVFNWGVLSSGPHIVRGQIRSTAGELFSTEPRTVSVVKPGEFEFVDQFSLSEATAQIHEGELVVKGIVVRDKASHQQKRIDARFRWFESSQSFGMVEAATTDNFFSVRPFLSRLLSPLVERLPGVITGATAQASTGIVALLESPEDGHPASGVTVIRGWAFPEDENSHITEVHLVVDNQPISQILCCSKRADVAAVFPNYPHAIDSGWGISFNYGLLSAGPHNVTARFKDAMGTLFTGPTHNITIVKPGGFEFLDQFSLSTAQAQIEGEDLIIQGARVRDKATRQTKEIDVRLRWFTNRQGLGIVSVRE